MPPNINLELPTTNNNDDLNTSSPDARSKICRACGAAGVKNRCGACRAVFFCNRACQMAIWTAHRPECKRLIANANANANAASIRVTNVGEPTPAQTADRSNRAEEEEEEQPHATSPPLTVEVSSSEVMSSSSSSPTSSPPSRPSSSSKKKAVVLVTEPEVLAVIPPPVEEEEQEDAPSLTPPPSSTKAAKKKKNKKKKTRSNSLHAPASAPMAHAKLKSRSQSLSAKKHVVWGEVRAREFTRFPGGGGAVPYDGSWALGLGSPVRADVPLGSVLEVEELRLHELEARAKDLTKSQRAKVREGETRQFDYKSGVRNPLFGRLSERERRRLFSKSELLHLHELEEQVAHRKRSMSSEAPSSPGIGPASEPQPMEADFACVASEQLNEFVVIRDSRDDACGCSCGELLKRVAKMNVKKLHAFLSERKAKIVGGHSKPELLAQAKAIALREQNCSTAADCECARNGVGCHANVCVGCAGDCHNPHSQYAYDKDQVLQYRKQMIAQWNEAQRHLLDEPNQQHEQQQQQQHTLHKQRSPICVA